MKVYEFLKACQCDAERLNEYYLSKRIGHSKLVNFETFGPSTLKEDYNVEKTPAMIFGSLVDTLLTNPYSFESTYYVPKSDVKLSNSEKVFYEYLQKYDIRSVSHLPDEDLLVILDRTSFYTSLLAKTRIKKIRDKEEVYNELLKNEGKIIINHEDLEKAKKCVEVLRTSDITKNIFDYDLLFQVEVNRVFKDSGSLDRFGCHGLFDIIAIDTKTKTIYPFDLKTTVAPESDFLRSFYKFKYYRQAEMYIDMLQYNLNTCDDYQDWKIEPFKFIVISPNSYAPLIYEFPIVYENKKLKISENTFVPPYTAIFDEMIWHLYTGQYDYTKDVYMQIYKYANQETKHFITIPILNNSTTQTKTIETEGFDDLPYLEF